MSKVIKDNNGVTVVEGTPAASLVKDVEKFFASKPPERMAGESISQPTKIDENKIMSEAEYKADAKRRMDEFKEKGIAMTPEPYSRYLEKQEPGYEENQKARIQEEFEKYKEAESSVDSNPRRNEAKDKAESRRVRSKMESQRSQREQDATKGKFITTLGR